MLVLIYQKGGGKKKNIKQGFVFATPFLRGREGSKSERGQGSKNTTMFTLFLGGLKHEQEVVTPLWAQNIDFQKYAKTLVFKCFQEKLVVAIFGGKGYVRKRANKNQKKR